MQQDKESTGIGIVIIADLVVLILNDEVKHLYDKLAGSCRKSFEKLLAGGFGCVRSMKLSKSSAMGILMRSLTEKGSSMQASVSPGRCPVRYKPSTHLW